MDTFDLRDLERAKVLLESSGLAARITDFFGVPIEKGLNMLPPDWNQRVMEITKSALSKAVQSAVMTMRQESLSRPSCFWHKVAVGATGGIGGFFGLGALAVELPISTVIMMRSIADIARSQGESVHDPDTRMACMETFALGSKNQNDSGDSSYFTVRAALASSMTHAAEHLSQRGIAGEVSPAIVRLITRVTDRFSLQVSEKAVAQALPALGAAGGAVINTLFMDHFQDRATGHFIVRRLERKYGPGIVKEAYHSIKK
ncbi:MAG: EcsC family protein [Desulfamplus sp.]|nr:EcsC family protein [Desulfamplus sp.]